MATSLATQLQRLANATTATFRPSTGRHVRASFLFTTAEAERMDLNTVHGMGVNGLEELVQLNPQFSSYETTLFGEGVKDFDRTLQNKEANEKLDISLSTFLRLLGPYFLLKPAHKCLEFLVRCFRIHVYNVDAVMECILPYHETMPFVRMVAILRTTNTKWAFLGAVRKERVPLDRATLATQMLADRAVFSFLCEMMERSVATKAPSKPLLSLYATTVLEVLVQVPKVTDDLVAFLLPHISYGLRAQRFRDVQSASYMIVTQLSARVAFAPDLAVVLMHDIAKSANEATGEDVVACLAFLCQTQKLDAFPEGCFKFLVKVPRLLTTISRLVSEFDVARFMALFLNALAWHVHVHDNYVQLLRNSVATLPELHPHIVSIVITLLTLWLEKGLPADENIKEQLEGRISGLLRALDQRYPEQVDDGIRQFLAQADGGGDSPQGHDVVARLFQGTRHHALRVEGDEVDTTLFLALESPVARVRAIALRELDSVSFVEPEESDGTVSAENQAFVMPALLRRLRDDEMEVVAAALSSKHLVPLCEPEALFEVLTRILCDTSHTYPIEIRGQALRVLVRTFVKRHPSYADRVVPFLLDALPARSETQKLSISAVRLAVKCDSPLFARFNEISVPDLAKMSTEQRTAAYVSFNRSLVERLATTVAEDPPTLLPRLLEVAKTTRGQALALVVATTLLQFLGKAGSDFSVRAARILLDFIRQTPTLFQKAMERPNVNLEEKFGEARPDRLLRGMVSRSRAAPLLLVVTALEAVVTWTPPRAWDMFYATASDTPDAVHLSLLFRLFETFASSPSRALFASHMRRLFDLHVATKPLKFLSFVWTVKECGFSTQVQVRSLHIAHHCLQALVSKRKDRGMPFSDFQMFVPSLMVALSSSRRAVRRAAIACLEILHEATSTSLALSGGSKSHGSPSSRQYDAEVFYSHDAANVVEFPSPLFNRFLTSLVRAKTDLLADCHSLRRLRTFLSLEQRDAEPGYTVEEVQMVTKALLSHAVHFDMPYPRLVLLDALHGMYCADRLDITHKLLGNMLHVPPDQWTTEDHQIVHLLISQFTSETAEFLNREDSMFLQLFRCALESSASVVGPDGHVVSPRRSALECLTASFWEPLSDAVKRVLFNCLLEIVGSDPTEAASWAQEAIRRITLPTEIVRDILLLLVVVEDQNVTKRRKKPSRAEAPASRSQEIAASMARITSLLEILQYKDVVECEALLSPLFGLLQQLIDLQTRSSTAGDTTLDGDTGNEMASDYTQQLVLRSILSVTKSIQQRGASNLTTELKAQFNVETVIRCIQGTKSAQTRNHALLLITGIASLLPELVLSHLMTVVSLMGGAALRAEDNHTFAVVQKTIEAVAKPLVTSEEGAGPFLRVFVHALPSIPAHRRLALFCVLLSTLSASAALHPTLALLLEREIKESSEEDLSLAVFGRSLCLQFPTPAQVRALVEFVMLVLLAPEEKKAKQRHVPSERRVVDLQSLTDDEQRLYRFRAVDFVSSHLVDKSFLSGLLAARDQETSILQQLYLIFFQKVLIGIREVSRRLEADTDDQHWRKMRTHLYTLVDRLNGLLSTPNFVRIIHELLSDKDVDVRRKALELLVDRVEREREDITPESVDLLMKTIPRLEGMIKEEDTTGEGAALSKQLALIALEALGKRFASQHTGPFAQSIPTVVMATKAANPNVISSALLCLGRLCSALGPLSIPHLSLFYPLLLDILRSSLSADVTEEGIALKRLSALTSLQAIVSTLSQFIHPYLPTTLVLLHHPGLLTAGPDVHQRVTETLNLIAENVPARLLLPTLFGEFGGLIENGVVALTQLFDFLGTVISRMNRGAVQNNYLRLLKFYLGAFDLRRTHGKSLSQESISHVEDHVIQSFLSLVVKLNEVQFKPVFLKTFDWSSTLPPGDVSFVLVLGKEDGIAQMEISRSLFFYRLLVMLAERLKSIFVPFFGYVLDHCILHLSECRLESRQPRTSKDKQLLTKVEAETLRLELISMIINALHKCFLYDAEGFVNHDKFDKLLHPLVNQLENLDGGVEAFQERAKETLIPCLGQLAVTVASDTLWRPLNYQVLMKTRNQSPAVRFAALKVVEEFYVRLGEEFLVLLPETIPFLAELMEDTSIEVEALTQQIIRRIEDVSGESLQKYFE